MHLDDEQIQRLLDPSLAASIWVEAGGHLEGCAECRTRVADAEQEERWLFDRLGRLDHSVPAISIRDLMDAGRRRPSRWGRLAAGIALAVGTAGLAYAAPGSPLPRWVHRIAEVIVPSRPAHPAVQDTTAHPPAAVTQAGIAVEPGDRFVVELAPGQSLDSAVMWLTDSAELTVRARGGITSFTSDVGRLGVTHTGAAGILEIQVPRAAPRVELRLGGHQVWLKDRAQIRSATSADAAGRYHVSLTRRSR
jgi:hypothetical protein